MSKKYTVRANENRRALASVVSIGDSETFELDFSPWADDNTDLTSVTWVSKYGNGSISGEALSSNVATALVVFNQVGKNLIEVKAKTGTETKVIFIDVMVKDPSVECLNDYGMVC